LRKIPKSEKINASTDVNETEAEREICAFMMKSGMSSNRNVGRWEKSP
jgi:hypothetical protein